MFYRTFLKLTGIGAGLLCLLLSTPQASQAAGIGVKMASDRSNSAMLPADRAGAPGYVQPNWNNAPGGSGTLTAGNIKDSSGTAVANMTFTYASGGVWNALSGTSTNPNDKLNCGFVFSDTNTVRTWKFTNVPYLIYDVVIYFANDGTGRFSRINVNGYGDNFVRNANWSGANMGAYALAPYYDTSAKATADTKGYTHLVVKGVAGPTCSIVSQAVSGNYGICAVQLVPSTSVTRAAAMTTNNATINLGDVATFNTAFYNTGAAVTITRSDLYVDGVLVEEQNNPVGTNNVYNQYWTAADSFPSAAGRPYTVKTVLYASDNTSLTAGVNIGVTDNYNAYNVISKVTAFANGSTTISTSCNTTTDTYQEYAWKAMDRDINTRWNQKDDPLGTQGTPTVSPAWWQISTTSTKTINFYRLNGDVTRNPWSNRQPKNFRLLGSNDGTNWTALDAQTTQTKNWSRNFSLATPATYNKFRLEVSAYQDPTIKSIEVDEIQLLNVPAQVDMIAPLTIDSAKAWTKYTVKAHVTGTPGAGAQVRFFAGPRLLAKGVDKGNGNWEADVTPLASGTMPVYAQLYTPTFVINSGPKTNINVTVPVEMSGFSAE